MLPFLLSMLLAIVGPGTAPPDQSPGTGALEGPRAPASSSHHLHTMDTAGGGIV